MDQLFEISHNVNVKYLVLTRYYTENHIYIADFLKDMNLFFFSKKHI